jgi:hypothetical protein
MRLFMKYLLAILISFAIACPTFAAKTVQGTVPHPPPLQPPAAGIAPNYSHNIESTGRILPDQNNGGTAAGQPSVPLTSGTPVSAAGREGGASKNYDILWLAGLVVLGGAVVLWLLRRKTAA